LWGELLVQFECCLVVLPVSFCVICTVCVLA